MNAGNRLEGQQASPCFERLNGGGWGEYKCQLSVNFIQTLRNQVKIAINGNFGA